MAKRKDTFNSLKKNKNVVDSWYGPGKVLSDPKRGQVKIKLDLQKDAWDYDRQHVNHFVSITKKSA